MRLCKGTEGPRRVRQLDGAFLFGHERIVANPHRTHFGVTSELAVIRPELWETKISRPATLDECIGDYAQIEVATHYFWIADYTSM